MHFKVFKYFSKNLFQETNSNATNSRVFIEAHDVNVTSWTTETYCKETVAPPVEEFHMIVKKGKISKITGICIFQIPARILIITIFRGWNKCIEKIELFNFLIEILLMMCIMWSMLLCRIDFFFQNKSMQYRNKSTLDD